MRALTKLTQNFPVTQSDFESFEEHIGRILPQELKDLFIEYAGSSVLEKMVPPGDYAEVHWFLLLSPLYPKCPTIFEYFENVNWYMEAMADEYDEDEVGAVAFHQFGWVPFARYHDDLFCYQLSGEGAGSIYLLKDENRMDDTFEFIANSLDEFLDSLYPDPNQPV